MSDERRMGLGALTDAIGPDRVIGMPVGEVTGLAYDSRRVEPGTLFFAVPGIHVDGHEFVAEVVERGAIGIVVEREMPDGSQSRSSWWIAAAVRWPMRPTPGSAVRRSG